VTVVKEHCYVQCEAAVAKVLPVVVDIGRQLSSRIVIELVIWYRMMIELLIQSIASSNEHEDTQASRRRDEYPGYLNIGDCECSDEGTKDITQADSLGWPRLRRVVRGYIHRWQSS
jgi:hypothetical protein